MRKKRRINYAALMLVMMMTIALTLFGCGENKPEKGTTESTEVVTNEQLSEEEVTVLGEGETKFLFSVMDKEGNETKFEICTNKEMVGEALLDLGLISGDEGEFGLYIKEVNGITADYDIDQTYWAFYINGEYATSGADTTAIEEGAEYLLKVEK